MKFSNPQSPNLLYDKPSPVGYNTKQSILFCSLRNEREIARSAKIPSLERYRLKPNSMQEKFIANLRNILERGEERALLISATGTGKTYASAFAMRELGFQRVLFLVNRVTLAKQAKNRLGRSLMTK